eukprot:TRINITY_DN816_c0_g2_i1.p1 TRINITY_DN816_c0_g2~~TRINITY_DN816_c0_g2_i1.p1  ORF type:complete len:349 (-),score=106.84 TRINITY_DN816_c0_g2_i1:11-1057(-)
MTSEAEIALKTFEIENDITEGDDEIYFYSQEENNKETSQKPWLHDPEHYKHVKISALALIKMVMHARSGGDIEVMGLMQGKVKGDTMIVMDAYALPVQATETRVNAAAEAYEYMAEYNTVSKEVGRLENVLGWYHSHPGYGCWLSGIDVGTQRLNQQFQEPWLAIVIDPKQTMSAGRVELGAFRTYPEDYTPPNSKKSEYQSVPLDKIEDFGVHHDCFYKLDVSYFKSTAESDILSQLWNKYWINTLSSNPLLSNREYFADKIRDISMKCEQAEGSVSQSRFEAGEETETELSKVKKDSITCACEELNALLVQTIKYDLFNGAFEDDPEEEEATSSSSSNLQEIEMEG